MAQGVGLTRAFCDVTVPRASLCRRLLTPALTPPLAMVRKPRADARTRTGDPFITSEVLYQLSYVGGR